MGTLIAHEWIAEVGGSENVFEQLRRVVPHTRAVCLWNDDISRFPGAEETWLARTPLRRHKAAALPFMGTAWRQVDLKDVDQVVVSSHAFAHHLASRAASRDIPAFAYVHSPARYVWAPDLDIRGNTMIGRSGRAIFRSWDRHHVSRKVKYATNSNFVANRIREAWGVEATVVYPPVDIERIQAFRGDLSLADSVMVKHLPPEYVLGASRFVRYKNVEAAIRAGEILGLPVVLAGRGPDEARLRILATQAKTPVYFAGRVSDNVLIHLYRHATLFVHLAIEDFGIMPVEAIACGTPVVVNEFGGARESVLATGGGTTAHWAESHFSDPTVVEKAASIGMTAALERVQLFSGEEFRNAFSAWMAYSS